MKIIKYTVLQSSINHGTKENPDIEQIILDAEIHCSTQEQFDANYPIAAKKAVGEIIVEGEFDDVTLEPTQLDRIEAQVAYNSIMLGTLMEV